jgi:hypothetical protein
MLLDDANYTLLVPKGVPHLARVNGIGVAKLTYVFLVIIIYSYSCNICLDSRPTPLIPIVQENAQSNNL